MAETFTERAEVFLAVDADVLSRMGSLVRHLAVGLMDEPARVTVLSPTPGDGAEELVAPWPVIRPLQPLWPWRRPSVEELLEEFELEPPQVIHCLSPALAEWVCDWFRDQPAHIVVHAFDHQEVAELATMRLPHRARMVLAFPALRTELLQRRPDMEAAISVVPLGIPAQLEPACLDEPERIPAVIVTAPLTKHSGIDRLLQSFAAVVKRGQDVQLFLLATGPAEYLLRRQVERLGLRSNVTFAGPIRDWISLNEAMQGADFFVMPRAPRRYSLSTLTALAHGLAVIAPDDTIEDYLIDGVTARLFDAKHPEDLERKWGALLQDPVSARQLAASALGHVRVHHQASTMITSLCRLYCDLASHPGGQTSAGK